jgi:hypothetical protein
MRWMLLALLIALTLGACTPTSLTLSPALDAEIRAWVRMQCAPGGVLAPCPTAMPEAAPAIWEVG